MKYTSSHVQLKKRKKGTQWQARVKYKDTFGKWQEVSKMLPDAKGKKEAERMAREWMDELNAQAELMPNPMDDKTVGKVYVEFIKYQLDRGEIEKSTYTSSLYTYNKYIKCYIGDCIFTKIDKTIINDWLTKLYNRGLAQNTIRTTYSRLKKVYNYFYENGELTEDYFRGVKIPKKGSPQKTHLTKEQMDDILTALYSEYEAQDPMFIGILLAFYAGLRRGEMCALRWNDIDFDLHTISVRSAVGVSRVDGLGDYTKMPKNNSSYRTFPMLPQLEQALLERKKLINPNDNWFVIGNEDVFMRPAQYNRLFSDFVSRHNFTDAYGKKVKPHGLRHNLATVGINAGMDIASLSLMMGHASRAMTLDTYGDANADALALASEKLSEKFKNSSDIEKLIAQTQGEQKQEHEEENKDE